MAKKNYSTTEEDFEKDYQECIDEGGVSKLIKQVLYSSFYVKGA